MWSNFLLAMSTSVELVVPAIRVLGGRRGVQTGPAIGSLLSFAGGLAYFKATLHQPAGASSTKRWIDHGVTSTAVVLPALGAILPGTVVLRRRSPLWSWALCAGVRIAAASVLAADADRLKKRRQTASFTGQGDRGRQPD